MTMRTALIFLLLGASFAHAQQRGGHAPVLRSVRLVSADKRALPAEAALIATLNKDLGKPIDEAEKGHLADLVVEHLRQQHWPVCFVTVWDEDEGLANGDVTLQVQQGCIGKIGVVGGSQRRQMAAARKLADLSGKPLDGLELQRRLDWLGFSPWLAAVANASPGETLSTADLMFNLRDQNPIQAFASYENNGVEPLGENRYTVGIEWLNAFALGQDLTLTGSMADDPHTLRLIAASWRIPLPWHHELRFSGYYADSHSTTELLGIPFDENGVSWTASVRYVVPWRFNDHWRSEWSLGFDYKQFNNEFIFGSTTTSPLPVGAGVAVLGTQFSYDAGQNHARMSFEVAHGGNGWAEHQTEDPYDDLNPGAKPDFTILRGDANFEHDFNNDVQLCLRLGGQWADGPQLASEEIALASVNAVRGYPERSVRASSGVWASLEARSPAWQWQKSRLKFRALAFADGGWSADSHVPTDTIASVGIGLRAELTTHLQLRCDLAIPLIDRDDPRVHIAAVVRF